MADRAVVQGLLERIRDAPEGQGLPTVKELFSYLGYEYLDAPLRPDEWPNRAKQALAPGQEPRTLFRSGEFQIAYVPLRALRISVDERPVMSHLLKQTPYLLAVFSDPERHHWHFVNAKWDDEPKRRRLFRQLKEGGKALDVEKTILESLLRRVAEDQRWCCEHCGGEIPEPFRKQAIEDFVYWGGISSIKPPGRDISWDDWVEGIFYQHTEDQFAGVKAIRPHFCSIDCERKEREYQEVRISAREEAERRPVEKTMGEYGWCSDHEMPIDERVASHRGYRCLDCEYVESAEDIEWFSIEEYAAKHKISTWKVQQMIKSGEVDARLMDKTRAWSPITRSIAPLKKWFIIVRKPTAVSE